MITVARLVARALDNRIRRLLLDHAAGISALTAELRGAAASGGDPVGDQGDSNDDGSDQGRVLSPHSLRDS